MKKLLLILAGAAAILAAPAFAADPAPLHPGQEAAIPFVGSGSIFNWQVVDRDTLYVQDVHRRWYRAELMSPCIDLPFAQVIGFDARGTDRFDRFSSVVVRGQHCAVTSLTESGPPPPRKTERPHG